MKSEGGWDMDPIHYVRMMVRLRRALRGLSGGRVRIDEGTLQLALARVDASIARALNERQRTSGCSRIE